MNKQKIIYNLVASVSLAPLTLAYAQTNETGGVDQIVVTAQKREQNIQDVGISITAFSSDDIKDYGFESAEDIASQTPNLTAVNAFGNNQPNFVVRGLGLNDISANNSSPTAVHLDEVFFPYAIMLNFGLFDIERVEVLKGPQGTLFGRNSTAGVVSYFSKKPTEELGAELTVGYGNYDHFEAEGFFNVPLGDKASMRVSAFYDDQNKGAYYNRFLDLDDVGGASEKYGWRAQLNLQPTEELEINLNVHGGGQKGEEPPYDALPNGNATLTGHCDAYLDGTLSGGEPDCFNLSLLQEPDDDPFTNSAGLLSMMEVSGIGFSGNINWDLGFATLTSVTGYEDFEREIYEDADGFPLVLIDNDFYNKTNTFSQELRLTSAGDGPFKWMIGAYWQQDELDIDPAHTKAYTRNVRIDTEVFQDSKTAAAFVNGSYQFNDKWALSGGLRYTWEEREYEGRTFFDVIFSPPTELTTDPAPAGDLFPFGVPAAERVDSNTFKDLSGKIEIDYTPNADMLFYASFAKGFKSGGFNGNIALNTESITAFDKEQVYAYEIGKKLTIIDNTLRWNSAFFYYDYKDAQMIGNFQTQIGTIQGNLYALTNLSDADVFGLESDIQWKPVPELDVRLGVGWLDTKLKNKKEPPNNGTLGDELAYAPDISLNGSIGYSREIAPGYVGSVLVSANYQGEYFTNVANLPVERAGDYVVVNGRASLYSSNMGWQVEIWAKNILNEEYIPYVLDIPSVYTTLRHVGAPRTFGVSLSYAFN